MLKKILSLKQYLKCPKCSVGDMFASLLKIKLHDNCPNCSQNLEEFDVGDGPAYFGILIVGTLIPILAVIIEIYYAPSFIIHGLLWVPLTVIFSYIVLIISKGIFIHAEYKLITNPKEANQLNAATSTQHRKSGESADK